uniref:Uncharacterized protein n=1 Tax=Anguilla anguilla TaxID=7936 RepID=A0A0E9U7A3_ANGAN
MNCCPFLIRLSQELAS